MKPSKKKAESRTTEAAALTRFNTRKSATHCHCGGTGAAPGMCLVCPVCAGTDRYAREVFLRRLIGCSGLSGGAS